MREPWSDEKRSKVALAFALVFWALSLLALIKWHWFFAVVLFLISWPFVAAYEDARSNIRWFKHIEEISKKREM